MEGNDASHDWNHIQRVLNLAKSIAEEEGITDSRLEIIQIAAILHDIKDWKYSGR